MIHSWLRVRQAAPVALSALLLVLIAVPGSAQSAQTVSPTAPAPSVAPTNRPASPPQSNGGVSPAPWNWWKAGSEFHDKLNLSKTQSDEIQRIYEVGMKIVRAKSAELQEQLEKLSKVNRPDETLDVISQQIHRVEASRSEANEQRTLMLIKMRRVLNPEQTKRFEMLAAKWMRDQDQNQNRQNRDQRPGNSPQNDGRNGRPGF
jgi:Spy/CpxP family protein refolding chaperone